MKGFLIFVFGAVLGGIASLLVTGGLMAGAGAGIGIATGLKTGACLTAEGARKEGIIRADQVDQVLQAAGRYLAQGEAPADVDPFLTGAACEKLLADLKSGMVSD